MSPKGSNKACNLILNGTCKQKVTGGCEDRHEDKLPSFITQRVPRTEAATVSQHLTEDPKTWFALGLLAIVIWIDTIPPPPPCCSVLEYTDFSGEGVGAKLSPWITCGD